MTLPASAQPKVSVQLEKLAKTCRRFLSGNPSPERVALAYLHVRNAHPTSLGTYADLFDNRSGVAARLRVSIKSRALAVLALYRREKLYFGDNLPDSTDILFISHFTNGAQAGSGFDNYFGNLPEQMTTQGKSSVVAYINHTWMLEKDVQKNWYRAPVPRVILSRTTGMGAENKFAKSLRQEGRVLGHQKHAVRFDREVASHTALNAANSAGTMALRTATQIADLVKSLRPKILITTFEGHAWERLVFHAARSALPEIKCIGYHHAVLFPLQYALGTRLGHGYDPDAIMTAGDVSKEWFTGKNDWAGIPIETLGSVRTPKSAPAETPNSSAACLVVPEGLVVEALRLFRLAVSTARLMPEQQFRLRLHPLLSREDILSAASDLKTLPPNVVWSDCSLEEDLVQSRSALYRGSTVAITAVLSGLRPIYASDETEEISIDPLDNMPRWHKAVSSAEMLRLELAADLACDEGQREAEFAVGREYCERYFRPMSVTAFSNLMKHLIET